jgi:hypothetical protein
MGALYDTIAHKITGDQAALNTVVEHAGQN